MTLIEFDNEIRTRFPVICGVDEAGRGPLAGDVYAAAVVFDKGVIIDGVNDSKKLSEKKREILFDEITSKAVSYSIATASVEEIESMNILNAAMLAMKRAVEGLSVLPDIALIDGNKTPDAPCKTFAVVKGDSASFSIAAASILAKVARDRYMAELDRLYPQYQFAKHKGYGTKLHYEMIKKYGISPVHRKKLLKKDGLKKMTSREIGNIGEDYTCKFLEKNGCTILCRNFTIKGGEIDIVAKKGSLIHFVEVKSRKKDPLESGEAAITKTKMSRIIKTATAYVSKFEIDCSCIFDVAIVEVDNGAVTDFKYIQRAFTA